LSATTARSKPASVGSSSGERYPWANAV
jgi:hypothetical protein